MRKILAFTLLLVTASLAAPNSARTGMDPDRLAQIRPRMQSFVDHGTMAGAVTLVQRHGEIASLEAVGFQDLETKKPMRTDTIFQIMSMTKPFTATGIMILMEEGRLSLTDPVEKHLPEFAGQMMVAGRSAEGTVSLKKPSRPITIRDLMTHTSGMPGGLPTGLSDLYRKFDKTLAEAVAVYSQQPLQFEPDTEWRYSNMGMATLGRIIEVVSGQPYERFIAARIFEPLGMKDSFFFLPRDRWDRLASVYTFTGGKLVKTTADIYRKGAKYPMPEGGIYSTATDLAAFYQMMLNKGTYKGRRILSKASVEVMTLVHTGSLKAGFAPGVGYGLGWSVVREPLGTLRLNSIGTFSHGGAYRTYGWVDPAKDLIGVILMQRTNVGGDLADEISALMTMAASAITD
jgi:CubicO group peptidase (beta-lactamase class C family)